MAEKRKKLVLAKIPDFKPRSKASPQKTYLVSAAIDFGTTFSGYAFSFKHDHESNPLKIHANEWKNVAQGQMHVKTPSCLLLNPDKSLHSFGHEARDAYNNLCLENQNGKYYFFWQFKMTLHQQKEIKPDYQLADEGGRKLDALTVFSRSISYLRNHLMKVLTNALPGTKEKDVGWVITVPAIWNDSAKKFMRLAAEKAGIRKENLDVALEPEAASIYCRRLPVARNPEREDGVTKLPTGSRYIILDAGGGTVDVTVHEVLEGDKLKELHKATGGNWGGNSVNKRFWSFLAKIVGTDVFEKFSREHKGDYLELLDDFEGKKRLAKPDATDTVTIRLPTTLQTLFKKETNGDLDDNAISRSRYAGKVRIVGDKLRIDSSEFNRFFEEPIRDIIAHLHDLIESLPTKLNAILMVGGFSESPVLQKAVREYCDEHNKLSVIIPADASLCVLKGAVLFGHEPDMVTERKAMYTYGVAMVKPFNKRKHDARKKIEVDGEALCNDLFDKHVEEGEPLKVDEVQAERVYYPMSATDTTYPVILYRSTSRNPTYVDERGCECVGYYLAKRKVSGAAARRPEPVKVRLSFGHTDIRAEVVKDDLTSELADFKF